MASFIAQRDWFVAASSRGSHCQSQRSCPSAPPMNGRADPVLSEAETPPVRCIWTRGESGCAVTLRAGVPEGHAEAGCCRVGADNAAGRVEGAVEQGRLDPHVV